MKKISSAGTFFYKRIFPVIWFGFLGILIIMSLIPSSNEDGPDLFSMVVPIFMGGIGYFMFKNLVFDLMDEVCDAGDCLVVRNAGKEEQITLKEIKNISYTVVMNPSRVTLSLRRETVFGSEISFSPNTSRIPFKKNRDIEDLIGRVDKARALTFTHV